MADSEPPSDEEISEYELLRRKNIEERNAFAADLGVKDEVDEYFTTVTPKQPTKHNKRKRPNEELPRREPSRRIQELALRLPPKRLRSRGPIALQEQQDASIEEEEPEEEKDERLKGTIELKIQEETFDFLKFHEGSRQNLSFDPNLDISSCSLDSFRNNLGALRMVELRKVVERRIQSMCVHPTLSKQIVLVGSVMGMLGIWDLNAEEEHDLIQFEYHRGPVNCTSVSRFDQQKIFTTSHEGSVCCVDLSQKKCTNVFSSDFSFRVKHLTWHDQIDANTLLIAHGNGSAGILDLRDDSRQINWINCFDRSCRTVQLHPTKENYFLASSGTVGCRIFDLRCTKGESIVNIDHPKGLTSAFFSPDGNRIASTCNDDFLRVFDSSSFESSVPIKKTIPHNNHTGRWLSVFKTVWFPFRSDAFLVGSLLSPRRIQVYNAVEGNVLYELRDDNMVTISPVIAVHPEALFVAGGNSSGRVHAFVPPPTESYE